ncbi:MAG: DnaJ domain-containing protein [Gammaproteobacteria bacterium]|nr:DnaJ domain-containing protein [Gammaproteobacteria bacterium]
MDYKDYYAVLGVARDATQDEVKRAYRKLARKYHPDVSKETDAERKFKDLGEAYEVLKDPEKRAAYDQLGKGWQSGQDFRPPPGWDSGFEFSGGGYTDAGRDDFSDFFESLFGRAARGQPRARGFSHAAYERGQDHHATIDVSLDDAYNGATLSLQLQVPEYDPHGRLSARQRKLQVKIPRGVTSGKRIRLAGQGAPGASGTAPGDLYLTVNLKNHRLFEVDGKDVFLTLPVTPWEAALGAKVEVPTLAGKVDLAVPAGARSGQKLRLKGRGLPVPGGAAGDQFAIVQITTPPADTAEKKAFYENMRTEFDFDPRTHFGGH